MQHTSSAALVTNNAAAVESLLQSFTSNASTKLVRNDKMAGRDYVVVPMVMIVEGVLNGSKRARVQFQTMRVRTRCASRLWSPIGT